HALEVRVELAPEREEVLGIRPAGRRDPGVDRTRIADPEAARVLRDENAVVDPVIAAEVADGRVRGGVPVVAVPARQSVLEEGDEPGLSAPAHGVIIAAVRRAPHPTTLVAWLASAVVVGREPGHDPPRIVRVPRLVDLEEAF